MRNALEKVRVTTRLGWRDSSAAACEVPNSP